MLGFRQMLSDEQLRNGGVARSNWRFRWESVITRGTECYFLKQTTEKTVLLNHRQPRGGKSIEVVLRRQFETL